MTLTSPNLNLPYVAPAQAQKHVTVNEAFRKLDLAVQACVNDKDLTAPPASPNDGDQYLIAAPASGDWENHDNDFAVFADGFWQFLSPKAGWQTYVVDETLDYRFDGTDWLPVVSGGGGYIENDAARFSVIGIGGATGDSNNPLSINGPAALFNNAGDDMRLKVNKAASNDTASFVFQTGFSGRAEIGLTGDDLFSFKVSSDGSNFDKALVLDEGNSQITTPYEIRQDGVGGPGAVASTLRIFTGDDVKNSNTVAHTLAPTRNNARLHFGTASAKFFSLSLQYVSTIENMPQFSTKDAISIGGGGSASSFSINRSGTVIRHWGCGPNSTSGHQFYANSAGYTTSGATLAMYIQESKVDFGVPIVLPSFTVSTLPSASETVGGAVYVSDETGGAIPAFSDGTNWRRYSDRAIVS